MQFKQIIASLALATLAYSQAASQLGDGQIQQITDGQVQAVTNAPPPATQIHDGQIQVPTSLPTPSISQIHDGQVQVPTGTGSAAPTTNGTFTSPAPPAATFTGAANLLAINKEMVLAMGAAAGFAML